jgi:phage-related protein
MGNLNDIQLKKLQASRSLKTKFMTMQVMHVDRQNIQQVLKGSEGKSGADLELTSKAILLRSQQGDFEEAFELASWSSKAIPESRKVVVRSFLKNRQAPLLVHQIARMKRSEAGDMMKDYFGEGGDIKDVAEWMSAAGNILKTGMVPNDTDGLWGWVKDTAGSVVDAVVGAINTVADAIATAGQNLADAVTKVVIWSQSKINDFVEAVLAAGKSISQLLSEAVKKGVAAVKKFVQAIIEVGKKALDILDWAISQVESTLKEVITHTVQQLSIIIGAMKDLAISLSSIINDIAGFVAAEARKLMQALRIIWTRMKEILEVIAQKSVSVIPTLVTIKK